MVWATWRRYTAPSPRSSAIDHASTLSPIRPASRKPGGSFPKAPTKTAAYIMEVVVKDSTTRGGPSSRGPVRRGSCGRKRRRFRRRANEGEYDLSVDDRDSGARIRAGTLSRQRSGRDSWPMRMQLLVSHNINGTIYPRGAVVAVRDDLWKERTATIDRKGCRQPQTAIGLEEGQEEVPPDKLPPFNPEVPPVPAQRPARTSIPFAMW